MLHMDNVTGRPVRATDGELGHIEDALFDDRDWTIRYFVVDTGGWLRGKRVLITPPALAGAPEQDGAVSVKLSRDEIRSSPPAGSVTTEQQQQLADYYGIPPPHWRGGAYPLGWTLLDSPAPQAGLSVPKRQATHLHSFKDIRGYSLAADGQKLGRVDDIIVDEDSWTVHELAVNLGDADRTLLQVEPGDIEEIRAEQRQLRTGIAPEQLRASAAAVKGYVPRVETPLPHVRTVGDHIVRRLGQWGVRRIYGYPGDGINGIMGALDRAREAMHFVQARHEELAAFMACAHAKFTGNVGVCLATSGPGAIHLLNGLYDAKLDHQPVVAIIGQQKRAAIGGDYQQEVDLQTLFKDVAHEYVQTAMTASQVRHLVDRAVRIALDRRTVTCLIFPHDVQDLDAVTAPAHEHGTVHTGIGLTGRMAVPQAALERAAQVLNAGERVAILVGAGALHATDEVIEVAELLGAGIAKALLGKAAVPDDLPFVTGSIGLLGTQPSWDLMRECDTLLMVGSSFPYSEFLPREGQARGVQIDIDGRRLSMRYPMEVGLIGDAKTTLRALMPHLQRKEDRRWREHIESRVERWWRVLEARAMNEAKPINPQRVFWELSPRLPDECILTCDSGSAANWYARDVKLRRGMQASLSGGLATMGPAIPYAIAAKYAHPGRHVIALLGDGSMQMNGLNGLITIAKVWREWAADGDARLTVMVLNNGDLNQVTWEQRAMAGDPKFEGSQYIPDFPYAEYAQLLGLKGERVDNPDEIGPAWDRALAADRPYVLEMVTDPDVPPLPPHIEPKQARAYLAALLKGDPDALGIVRASAKDWWDSLFPPRH